MSAPDSRRLSPSTLWRLDRGTSRILRGMATLASGSFAAKLITLVSLPVITRLYAPEHLGALTVFTGLVILLTPLVTLQYNRGLPVARCGASAINLLALTVGCILGVSLLLGILLAFGAGPALELLSMQVLLPYWWLLPLGILAAATYVTLQLWATRARSYRRMAGAEVTQSAVASLGQIAMFFMLPGALALILARVLAQAGAMMMLAARFRADLRRLARHVSLRRMRVMAWRYRSFPTYRLPSQLTLITASKMPVFYIAGVHGAATAGQFGLAMMALALPMSLIGRNMGKAFFGEAAQLDRTAPTELRRMVVHVTRILGGVGMLATAIIMLAAPPLFPVILGAQWVEAGQFAAALALFLTAQFVTAPVMNTLTVINREDMYLQINLQRLFLATGVFLLAYLMELSPFATILSYSVALTLHYILTFWRVLRAIPDE